jgi:predicted enzyme involved in methoxymalonyl-ACP biosynthesis
MASLAESDQILFRNRTPDLSATELSRGRCGISSLVRNGATGQIVDFLLSCRVVGRGAEDALAAAVRQHARDLDARPFARKTFRPPETNRAGSGCRV